MSERAESAKALLECLRDVSSLLDQAQDAAVRQQEALVQGDADVIATTCVAQDDIMRRVAQTDERAASVAAKIAEQAGLDSATAGAEAIAKATGDPYTTMIEREMGRISELSRTVQETNEVNSRLLRNGLEVISSCLRIIVREPEPVVYSQKASLAGPGSGVLSLDSRV